MRLKLSGPDYKDQDPVKALADFRERVALYEKAYVPLGDYEERNDMPYIQVRQTPPLAMLTNTDDRRGSQSRFSSDQGLPLVVHALLFGQLQPVTEANLDHQAWRVDR